MATNIKRSGDRLKITATSAISAGDIVEVENMVGVAPDDIANGEEGWIIMDCAVSGVAKATGSTWTAGETLYWDGGNSRFTTSSSGNTKAGVADADAASGDETGDVLLIKGASV
jgi:predicted RecA/RadA family phage recombinase